MRSALAPSVGPELTDAQFRKIAGLVHQDSGIILSEAKRSLLMARLNRRLRVLGLPDYGAYCARLDGSDGPDERRHLLSAITTNVTAFFREAHHFRSLAQDVLPPMVAQARAGRRLRLWSAASSSGEEPYSIAITLLEAFPDAARHDVLLLSTDIDPEMVDRSRQGRFSADAVSPVPPAQLKRWFQPQGDGFEAKPDLRGLMRFAELNLHDAWPFQGRFDVIFCRNTAIYFDGTARQRLWQRFGEVMVEGGTLCIGHSERLDGPAAALFEPTGTTQYRRNARPAPARPS
ncbi:CheR family methyltransferase [Paracoccus aestuarii]|uniref:CheR family methyltransferase n=1 Tax=Paracoccus aestuarii TaxID=453842 RepID=UPI001F0C06C0|nr:protein-glutamate O-methyltransferase [Paracoccus aestuarii]